MNPTIKAYLATIGGKGGKATGKRKARSPEHYRAAQLKGAAARSTRRGAGGSLVDLAAVMAAAGRMETKEQTNV